VARNVRQIRRNGLRGNITHGARAFLMIPLLTSGRSTAFRMIRCSVPLQFPCNSQTRQGAVVLMYAHHGEPIQAARIRISLHLCVWCIKIAHAISMNSQSLIMQLCVDVFGILREYKKEWNCHNYYSIQWGLRIWKDRYLVWPNEK